MQSVLSSSLSLTSLSSASVARRITPRPWLGGREVCTVSTSFTKHTASPSPGFVWAGSQSCVTRLSSFLRATGTIHLLLDILLRFSSSFFHGTSVEKIHLLPSHEGFFLVTALYWVSGNFSIHNTLDVFQSIKWLLSLVIWNFVRNAMQNMYAVFLQCISSYIHRTDWNQLKIK